MAWQPPKGMDEYLKPTELCDSDNARLQSKAKEIVKDAETPKDASLKVFYFVRDEIPWMSGAHDVRASSVVKRKKGHCCNKTNLQVALLRAVSIPARYHQKKVKREWFKGVSPSFLYNRHPEIIPFCSYCECYLSERWVACDSVLDKPLYEAMLRAGLVTEKQIPTIDWDGERDLVVRTPWITENVGTFASFDSVLREAKKESFRPRIPARLFGWFVVLLSNQHIDKIRKH